MAGTESVAESAAIEALGSFFKITEVFLWDHAMVSVPEDSDRLDSLIEEPTTSCTISDINSITNHTVDDYTSLEDFELAKHMDALGLPISFSTTKQKNNVAIKGKRKETWGKPVSASKNIENRVPGGLRSCLLEDNSSTKVLHDSTNISLSGKTTESDTGAAYHDVYEGLGRGVFQLDRESLSLPATVLGDIVEKQVDIDETDVIMNKCTEEEFPCRDPEMEMSAVLQQIPSSDAENFPRSDLEDVKSAVHCEEELVHKQVLDNYVEGSSISCYITGANNDDDNLKTLNSCPISMDSSLSCAPSDHHVPDSLDNFIRSEFGDWGVIWDSFYERNYFYNFQSQESTWYPPPGLEHFALSSSISNSNELSTDTDEEHTGMKFSCDTMQDINLHGSHDRTSLFQEKEDDPEYLNHSSEEVISSRISNDITANLLSAHSDEHVIVQKINDKVSLHRPTDHSTDEFDVYEYREKREKHITSSEACNVLDVPLELLVSNSLTDTVNGGHNGEDGSDSSNTGVTSSVDELDSFHAIASKKKKKRIRSLQSQLTLQGGYGGLPASIIKYWCQRYLLFSQFDNGIKLDEEGWFSVTPEAIASHHASRCGSGIIIDCFTGVGGNAIQFAMRSNHVIAVDIDPQKIDYAQHNAAIYGVSDQINFIIGNFFQIAPRLKADVIFLSPPWGGPDYSRVRTYDIRTMLKPCDGQSLFEIAKTIASKVVMFLPRNVDLIQLAELSLSVNPPWTLEVEKNFLNGRLKAITAYFDKPTL